MKRALTILVSGWLSVALHAAVGPPMITNTWKFDLRFPSDATPAIAPDGTIYVGNFRGHFFAISPAGEKRWEFHAGREIKSSAAVASSPMSFTRSC